jgi:hypothetical protein
MEQEPFIVDLNDPADMAAKLPQAERILDETNRELAQIAPLQQKAREWQLNVEILRSKLDAVAPQSSSNGTAAAQSAPNGGERADVQSHVVGVVKREMRKIKASQVRELLADEGHDFTPEQVSNALHHAATGPKLIQKWPERGMYAPLGYDEASPQPQATPPLQGGVVEAGRLAATRLVGGAEIRR